MRSRRLPRPMSGRSAETDWEDHAVSKKVLVTSRSFGKISEEPLQILTDAGLEVTLKGADFKQEEFEQMIPAYDALIIGAHAFPAEVMEKCSNLKIICKHGVGLDNIPLDKAKALGIAVTNTPGTNSNAVADLTFALMLASARCVLQADRHVHEGTWKTVTGVDVYGKTLGLLGFGAIARCVARRARGFEMKVLTYDPYVKELPEEFRDFVSLCDFDTVVQGCDYLSVHLPLTEETQGILSAPQLAKMKKGSFLINTARGGIVNEQDLYDALVSDRLRGAAMDVMETEPILPEHPLLTLDNVIITPHMGMYSREAMGAVSLICAQNVAACLCGGEIRHRVV